jgi:hypothetical protein
LGKEKVKFSLAHLTFYFNLWSNCMSWDVLPPEQEVRICGVTAEKATRIVRAFAAGATKNEIARIFAVKQPVVSQIINEAKRLAMSGSPGVAIPVVSMTQVLPRPKLLE